MPLNTTSPLAEAQARRTAALDRGDAFTAGLLSGLIDGHIAFGAADPSDAARFNLQALLNGMVGRDAQGTDPADAQAAADIEADQRFLVSL